MCFFVRANISNFVWKPSFFHASRPSTFIINPYFHPVAIYQRGGEKKNHPYFPKRLVELIKFQLKHPPLSPRHIQNLRSLAVVSKGPSPFEGTARKRKWRDKGKRIWRRRKRNDVVSNVRWMPRLETGSPPSLSRSSRLPIAAREPRAKIIEGRIVWGRRQSLHDKSVSRIHPRRTAARNDRAKWRRIVFADRQRERERVFHSQRKRSTCFRLVVRSCHVSRTEDVYRRGRSAALLLFFRVEGVSFRARYLEACTLDAVKWLSVVSWDR